MKISIIIPIYNVEPYLHQCIESIIYQSKQDFEVILVNDGSTDNSGIMCEDFAKENPKIKVFHKKNGGVSSARNFGLIQAKGEYVWFIDPDDWITKNAVEIILDNLNKNTPEMLVFSHIKFFEKSKIFKETIVPIEIDKTSISDYFLRVKNFRPNVWCYIYKKDLIKDSNILFLEQPYFEDEVFNLEFFSHAQSIMHIKNQLYFYRERENSAMTKPFSEARLSSYLSLLSAYAELDHKLLNKNCIWENIFTYINNIKSGMKSLGYSTEKQKKVISEVKSIFKRVRFLKHDSKGILLYKLAYNYSPIIFIRL